METEPKLCGNNTDVSKYSNPTPNTPNTLCKVQKLLSTIWKYKFLLKLLYSTCKFSEKLYYYDYALKYKVTKYLSISRCQKTKIVLFTTEVSFSSFFTRVFTFNVDCNIFRVIRKRNSATKTQKIDFSLWITKGFYFFGGE